MGELYGHKASNKEQTETSNNEKEFTRVFGLLYENACMQNVKQYRSGTDNSFVDTDYNGKRYSKTDFGTDYLNSNLIGEARTCKKSSLGNKDVILYKEGSNFELNIKNKGKNTIIKYDEKTKILSVSKEGVTTETKINDTGSNIENTLETMKNLLPEANIQYQKMVLEKNKQRELEDAKNAQGNLRGL